ncbi:MAG: YggT family protein [Candidatus Aminicenantes bacterium]|nr:YggT family protein [Candidatus Aminicenantes bacterium]
MLTANFILALARVLNFVVSAYTIVIVFRVILSWIQIPSLYPVAVIVYKLTEPLLKPIRKYVPPQKMGGLDLSPMILLIALMFINTFVIRSLLQYAMRPGF